MATPILTGNRAGTTALATAAENELAVARNAGAAA